MGYSHNNILFTVSGRAGSKGAKNKNIRNFLNKPLIYYTLSAIQLFQKYYQDRENLCIYSCLNTDSEQLIDLVKMQSMLDMFIIERAEYLSGDKVPKIDVTRDSLKRAEKFYGIIFDTIIDVDITSPLRTYEDIYKAWKISQKHPEADLTFSVTTSRRSPYFNMVQKKANGYHTIFEDSSITTRQQTPDTYDMNASIYIYKREYILKNNITDEQAKCEISLMKDYGILDIDSDEDFELMQIIADYILKKDEKFREVQRNIRSI